MSKMSLGVCCLSRCAGDRKRNMKHVRYSLAAVMNVSTAKGQSLNSFCAARGLLAALLCLGCPNPAEACAASAASGLKDVKRHCDRGLVHSRVLSEENACLYEVLVYSSASKGELWSALPWYEKRKSQDPSSLFAKSTSILATALTADLRRTYVDKIGRMRFALHKMERPSAQNADYTATAAEYESSKTTVEEIKRIFWGSRGFSPPLDAVPLWDALPALPDDVIGISFFYGLVSFDSVALDVVSGAHLFFVYTGNVEVHSTCKLLEGILDAMIRA
jgi:hypothetical protein